MKRTKLAKKSKNPTKKLAHKLAEVSHTFIRKRDGINGEIKGYCYDCGKYAEGQQFQCGHFIADAEGGAWLRYHPHNMHGQASGCNMKVSQERVKIAYTLKMIEQYGLEYVEYLRFNRHKTIKADSYFYQTMIDLYEQGDEDAIVEFLESL